MYAICSPRLAVATSQGTLPRASKNKNKTLGGPPEELGGGLWFEGAASLEWADAQIEASPT